MIYLKLIVGGLVLAALVALGLIVNDWREKAAMVPVLEQRIDQANAQIELERKQRDDAQAASKGYQDELATLRAARAAAPARAVRLCNVPARTAAAEVSAPEPGSDGGTTAPGGDAPAAGPDIGPGLYAIADRCDDLSAQVRGLHDFVRRMAAGQPPP